MGKIKWTEKASIHLQTIHEYIARDSKTYATRFVRSLIKATTKLETMPRIGRIVPELENYGFREVIYYNYRIVYRVRGDEDIEILAVLHAARNFKKAFYEEWELK
ncbi:MAG: type II toxin-antitoxin system RelE/ParE family toxin [Thermodesulfovibrionales bacterium]|nr:type II toxin-antitoxin system RelE/ParE family toxin [Thermodesulfovibrionales bacterium]